MACMFPADRRGLQLAPLVRTALVATAASCSCRRHWRQGATRELHSFSAADDGGSYTSMKIVRFAPDELLVRKRPDLFGFDEDHVLGVLHRSFDDEKRLFRNQQPHLLE